MTIKKLRKLSISGFRGVKQTIDLDFTNKNENILIYGQNAKGKSSIADSIEWFYSGVISELNKEGCSRSDYRHRRLKPDEKTSVNIEFSDPALNSEFVLNSQNKQSHSNSEPEFIQYLESSKFELLILRHKDLKKFVDETKGDKRKKIAELIGMDGWEKIRDEVGIVQSRIANLLNQKREQFSSRKKELLDFMKAEEFSLETCWQFAEKQATILNIHKKINSIDDLRNVDEEAKIKNKMDIKSDFLLKLGLNIEIIKKIKEISIDLTMIAHFERQFEMISTNPQKVLSNQTEKLFLEAEKILNSGNWINNECPLCGQSIRSSELLYHINRHRDLNKEFIKEIKEFEILRNELKTEFEKILNSINKIIELEDIPGIDFNQIKNLAGKHSIDISHAINIIDTPLMFSTSLSFRELNLEGFLNKLGALTNDYYNTLQVIMRKLAEPTEANQQIAAFQNLSQLINHLEKIQEFKKEIKILKQQEDSLTIFNQSFQQLRRETMGIILAKISDTVSRYFIKLHENEGFLDIQLKFLPEDDGVEFHIYYKGEEITPPRKFLSESYLNSLGVCLYLATAQAFNKENGFVILDDVVNSFDAEHRSQLAELLINEMSDIQLVILTHDKIWFDVFKRLAKKGWQYRKITKWSYEYGLELDYDQQTLLAECQKEIQNGNIHNAARRTRTYIENRLKKIMLETGVRVRFLEDSQNGTRLAGEMLAETKAYLKDRGFFDLVDIQTIDKLFASTFITNYGSHDQSFSSDYLTIGDVKFALDKMLEFEQVFTCQNCNKKIWQIKDKNYKMQCECGKLKL